MEQLKTKDISLFESGSGGEISLLTKDLSLSETILSKIYICLFGGNVEASTKGDEVVGEERFDWWGNSQFFKNQPSKQFNSETEKTLKNVSLNSEGRAEILRAINTDLKSFKNISKIEINVVLLSIDKLEINILANQPLNSSNNYLKLVWDNAKKEIITSVII